MGARRGARPTADGLIAQPPRAFFRGRFRAPHQWLFAFGQGKREGPQRPSTRSPAVAVERSAVAFPVESVASRFPVSTSLGSRPHAVG
jgi:hypothetical protein